MSMCNYRSVGVKALVSCRSIRWSLPVLLQRVMDDFGESTSTTENHWKKKTYWRWLEHTRMMMVIIGSGNKKGHGKIIKGPTDPPEVLPTGKNMHALDPNSIPTKAPLRGNGLRRLRIMGLQWRLGAKYYRWVGYYNSTINELSKHPLTSIDPGKLKGWKTSSI